RQRDSAPSAGSSSFCPRPRGSAGRIFPWGRPRPPGVQTALNNVRSAARHGSTPKLRLQYKTYAWLSDCRAAVMRLCKAHLRGGERLVAALVVLACASSAPAQEALLERKALTGNWNGVRPLLSEHGFEPYLIYSATVWSNLAGGRDTGVQPNG